MEQNNKIRVVMVCHFSNPEVRTHLPLDDRKLYTLVRKMLMMPAKSKGYGDIAPWDTSTINYFKDRDDIELHVISAHSGLKKRVVSFEDQGVHYNFVKCDIANMLKRIISNDSLWRKMNPMVKDVHKLVDTINPDIVVLMGTENAYYSGTVLGIKNYPVYILCQTIYNNPDRQGYNMWSKKNASTEMELFKQFDFFGVYCKMHHDLLKKYAPNAQVFKFGFPSKGNLLQPTETKKEFDFVNFALTMDLRKGFHDSIKALAIVKNSFPNVTLNLTGGCTAEQKEELVRLINELDLQENVVFTPFFEKQGDLFLHIQKSRFAVLPCKMDNTSGTMNQAMHLGLPLVVYKTTGTPSFNRKKECVLIAEHSNVEDLAAKMLVLMEHPEKAEMLAKNAREFQEKQAEYNRGNGDRLLANIRAVIDNYRNGTPIPQEQLFDPNKDE